ncbi:MAG: hypothetical protein F4W91_15440 [Gemmatimonadetes bacterium]|nr:hypothetical protein [Gemmatimonadota bacterium]
MYVPGKKPVEHRPSIQPRFQIFNPSNVYQLLITRQIEPLIANAIQTHIGRNAIQQTRRIGRFQTIPALQYPHNAVYSCHYHVIWCTKYRRSVLNAQMQARIKDCIHEKQEEYSYIMQECEVLSVDLTRFDGYLISNQKGDPLCHQHVRLIHPS